MAFKLVSAGGNVNDPCVVNVYASGVVHVGGVVEMATGAAGGATGYCYPGASSTTTSTIFGICQDYAQGFSDTLVRVIPITPEQIWEADTTSNTSTIFVFKRHALTDDKTVANTDYDQSGRTGVFLCLNVRGAAADKKMLGQFIKIPF